MCWLLSGMNVIWNQLTLEGSSMVPGAMFVCFEAVRIALKAQEVVQVVIAIVDGMRKQEDLKGSLLLQNPPPQG